MINKELIVYSTPKSPVSEAYRTLRTNIQFTNIDEEIKSIVVTSTGPGEGKSTVISNLAITMAQAGKRVLLIDADLRKPRIHKVFSLFNNKGLTNVLTEKLEYKDVIMSSEIDSLEILTSGPIPPNPAELLGSKRMKELLEIVRNDYDIVLIDSPPVGVVTDAAVLSNSCDGVILVCAVGQAVKEAAVNAKDLLQKAKANILGVVLNKVPINEGGYYKYHYYNYHQSYYGEELSARKKGRRKNKKAIGGNR